MELIDKAKRYKIWFALFCYDLAISLLFLPFLIKYNMKIEIMADIFLILAITILARHAYQKFKEPIQEDKEGTE
jgi:hypothetical protein